MATVDVFLQLYHGNPNRAVSMRDAFLNERYAKDRKPVSGGPYNPDPNRFVALISMEFELGSNFLRGDLFILPPDDDKPVFQIPVLIFFRSSLTIDPRSESTNQFIPEKFFINTYGEFVCLLPYRDGYYQLYRQLGQELALSILSSINDIAALKYKNLKTSLLERMLTNGGLTRYLQSNNEAFISYMSLGKIDEQIRLGHGPVPNSISYFSEDGTPDGLEFDFDFGRGVMRRNSINVIIGPNGVGKTRAITAFANATSRKEKERPRGALPWPSSVVIYSHDPGSFRKDVIKRKNISTLPLTGHRSSWKRLTSVFSKLIMDDSGYYKSFDLLRHLFAGVIPLEQLYLPLNPAASVPNRLVEQGIEHSGLMYIPLHVCMEPRDPTAALLLLESAEPLILTKDRILAWPSSGEMALFLFLMSVMTDCQSGSLIFIDEPENHLHPQFISILMDKLYGMLIDTDSLAIIVTHSPFVVRELDKSCVTIMKPGPTGKSELYVPTLQTHGANVSEISAYVFDDEHIKKGYEKVVDTIVENEHGDYEKTLKIIGENFGAEAINYLLQIKHEPT